jgi:hypothetical protein
MAIAATPPTRLPAMVAVFELLLPEADDPGDDDPDDDGPGDDGPGDWLGEDECEEVTVGETVKRLAAGEVTEPEVPINVPGPISGRSKKGTVKAATERTGRIPTTSSR